MPQKAVYSVMAIHERFVTDYGPELGSELAVFSASLEWL